VAGASSGDPRNHRCGPRWVENETWELGGLWTRSKSNNTVTLDIVATLSIGSLPPTAVVSRYPAANAGVPANSKVLVGWNAFPGATNYLFHVWVVNTDASATITAKTPLAFSATVYHSTKYTWDDTGFPTGTYQYALLPLDARGKALAGWSAPTQITIAS